MFRRRYANALKDQIESLYTEYFVAVEELDLTLSEDRNYLQELLDGVFEDIKNNRSRDGFFYSDLEDITEVPWSKVLNLIREYQVKTNFIPITEDDFNFVIREEPLWATTFGPKGVKHSKITYKSLLKEYPSFKYKGKQYISSSGWNDFAAN